MDEVDYFNSRVEGRTYFSKQFPYHRPNSSDFGQPGRNICQVFDCWGIDSTIETFQEGWVTETMRISTRRQIKICVAREAGHYKELAIQEEDPKKTGSLKNLLTLQGENINQFMALMQSIGGIEPSNELPAHIDSALLQRWLADRNTLQEAYRQDPNSIRGLIEDDPQAKDIKAIRSRREAVIRFEKLLNDSVFFEKERLSLGKNGNSAKPESVWQNLFEENQWILGAGMGVPLFTAYDKQKLETVVRGASFNTVGKRADALYTTSGIIKSFVFAEIKTPETELLGKDEYRSGSWAASHELSGGIAQVHTTVQLSEDEITGHMKKRKEADGSEILGSEVFLFRPRAYLIIGSTREFQSNTGGKNESKIRSFELFRASITTPEIITYDELLAKAKWLAYSDDENDECQKDIAD